MKSDIDIDCANRNDILDKIQYISAMMNTGDTKRKHNSGIYVTDIPYDPLNNLASIDYVESEQRNYVKLDLLNVWIYRFIKNEEHLISLMKEPNWLLLRDRQFVGKLIHISKQYDNLQRMPEPVDSIARMSMFLSIIRPGKKHLIGKTWQEVSETVWTQNEKDGYSFKKSHSVAYSQLVAVHMNLLTENSDASQIIESDNLE